MFDFTNPNRDFRDEISGENIGILLLKDLFILSQHKVSLHGRVRLALGQIGLVVVALISSRVAAHHTFALFAARRHDASGCVGNASRTFAHQ